MFKNPFQKLPKMFFGWSNLKWLIREFMAMYSTRKSYFSKKRFESSIAFVAATALLVWHVYYTRDKITNSEVLADATLLFIIAGYTVKQIESAKKDAPAPTETATEKTSEPDKTTEEG